MAGSAAARLTLELVTDAGKATKGIDQTERRFSKLGGTVGKVGKLAAGGLAVGLGAAAAAAVKLAQGAAEDEAGAKRLERALINTTGATKGQVAAVEDWITAQGKALGVADDELRPALGRLAASTGDVGKAQKLAKLAMDVSAGSGLKLENVAKLLAKANDGQVAGLSKLGIATKDASGKTLTFDQLTGKLARTFKGQASTAANTTAGRFNRLKLRLSEAGESIGAKLLPLGNKLAGWALRMAPRVEKLAGNFARKLGPAFRAVGNFINKNVVPAAQDMYRWFVDKIAPNFRKYVGPIVEGLQKAFRRLADKVKENKPELTQLLNGFKKLAEFVASRIMPLIGKTLGKAFEGAGRIIGGIIDTVAALVRAFNNVKDAIDSVINRIKDIDIPDINIPGFRMGPRPDFAGAAGGLGSYAGVDAVPPVVINVTGALDPDAVARQIETLLNRRARRVGGLA